VFYDDNRISIDGDVTGWFTDDTPKRFAAYGWQVIPTIDGHNPEAIKQAIEHARADTTKPTLLCCQTKIGFGAPNLAGSEKTHGAPLGHDEIAAAREHLGWAHPPFVVPDNIYLGWEATQRGAAYEAAWQTQFADYQQRHPQLAKTFSQRMAGQLPDDWAATAHALIEQARQDTKAIVTRKASGHCLNVLAPKLPALLGGSADLTGSNCTLWADATVLDHDHPAGRYIHYGVREFGMFAIMNGMALHGGIIPFAGTFLTFVDYGRNAVRLAALMRQKVIFVLTHDSIGLGEDGPTHQPIEHANMLRVTPGVHVWRPCDNVETAVAWQAAIEYQGPSCLLLTRQNVVQQNHPADNIKAIAQGGYILVECAEKPEAILLATGSEVQLAVQAAQQLAEQGHAVRVVSMPCADVFAEQPQAYRDRVLPPHITRRVAIEAGSRSFWYKYVGLDGQVIGIDRFGASAPYQHIYTELGLTVDAIVKATLGLLATSATA